MRFRRNMPEARLEMTPLIDVVFLLLTFFLFAIVLMVRADTLGVRLPTVGTGDPARGSDAITVVIGGDGLVRVGGDAVELAEVADRVLERLSASPGAPVFVAAEADSRSGDLVAVLDALRSAGVSDFALLGRPAGGGGDGRGTRGRSGP
ncbi:MAG: biopolymer transporter ExbD [Phycisphaerales bacterium]|nr:MAG: biopolymer transporter ExbD [Phycisphaerales bacterium]